jgi:hypothetical protein
MSRCTGRQSWHGGDRQNDWVWVKQGPWRCYGVLNWHLPWQLQCLFKIKLQNEDGAFFEYWLALALTTIPENSGNLDQVLKFEPVWEAPAGVCLQVFSMGNIVSCAHVIPETATSTTSVKNISIKAEWLRQSGRASSELSVTPWCGISPRLASTPCVMLHIALPLPFHRLFSLCWSHILKERSGVVAKCDHTSEWVHCVHACIGIAMQWVTLRKSLLTFLLPPPQMRFSQY